MVLACYPTTADNPRPDYPLPTGKVVPHMQTGSDAPLFADASARYPVVAFSHGYSGSPLSSDYISALSVFASYGYVVIAPFHGDLRFSDLKIDNLGDAISRGVALGQLHGAAGTATAFDIRGARPRARASAMARSHRCDTDRRLRGEHGRRDNDAVGRRRPDDLILRHRGVVETGHPRSADQGGGRLRAVFRAADPACIRTRPARARRHQSAVPRHQRDGGHDRSDHRNEDRHVAPHRDPRAGCTLGRDTRVRRCLDQRHLYVDAYVPRCGGPRQPDDTKAALDDGERGGRRRRQRRDLLQRPALM